MEVSNDGPIKAEGDVRFSAIPAIRVAGRPRK